MGTPGIGGTSLVAPSSGRSRCSKCKNKFNDVTMMGTHTTIYRTKSSIPFHCRFLASHGRSAYRAFRSVFSIHTGHVSFLPTIVQPLIQSSWKRCLHGSWIVGSKGFSPPRWELSWRSLLQSAQMWGFTDSFRPNDIVAACKHAHASLQILYEPHGQMLRLGQVLASRSTAAVTVMQQKDTLIQDAYRL